MLTQKAVTPEQLIEALDRQAKTPMVRIGESLRSLGLITPLQLDNALEQQRDCSMPLGQLLVDDGIVSRQDLQTALARKMDYPLVELEKFPIEVEAVKRIGFAVARRLKALPLLVREGRLVIAMEDLAHPKAIEELEFAAQMKVVLVLAPIGSLDAALRNAYEKAGSTMSNQLGHAGTNDTVEYDPGATGKLIESLEREGLEHLRSEDDKQIEQSDNSLVRLINNMIVERTRRASRTSTSRATPGARRCKHPLSQGRLAAALPRAAAQLSQRADRAHQDHVRPRHQRAPQAAGRQDQLREFSPPHRIELRIATIPTNSGLEDVVMRILASAKPIPLDELGPADAQSAGARIRRRAALRLLLCVGPDRLAAKRRRCTRRSATSTCPSARSGRPRIRSRSRNPACARCRSTRRSTGPSRRRCAPSCAPTRT